MRTVDVIIDVSTRVLDTPFTYAVTEDCDPRVGCAVIVPLRGRKALGYVITTGEVDDDAPEASKIKPVEAVVSEPYFDDAGSRLIRHIAHTYIAPLNACVHLLTPAGRTPKLVKTENGYELKKPARRRGKKQGEAKDRDAASDPEQRAEGPGPVPETARQPHTETAAGAFRSHEGDLPVLTDEQTAALATIREAMDRHDGEAVLIDGVTGSGKTEVYLRAIARALEQGKGAIVLVPEISLTPQTVARFEDRFGETVAVMHSRMTQAERYDQWCAARSGAKRVVVGPRSALFCPVPDLGLIVIDEEHEGTYKQGSAPRYDAREVAAWMARDRGITLIMGSATPSIEALARCKTERGWHRCVMAERVNRRPLPPVDVVDMAREFGSGSRSMFSRHLSDALYETVDAGQKSVLLLNQRGFANFMLCRECGFVPECPTCSVSMTYHADRQRLVCHHCGRTMAVPARCPECGSPYLRLFGAGTQRVEAELRVLLEGHDCRIVRMDSDTTSTRTAHRKLLAEFAKPGAAVLLGTQMIAKGLDFDDVTLVGVINADTQLKLPDFRASERTFDLIEQVAGRAGRADLPGRVVVQTYMADNIAITAAARYDRRGFLAEELPKRKMLGYPPYTRLVDVLVWGRSLNEVRACTQELADHIGQVVDDMNALGNAPDTGMGDGHVPGCLWSSLGAAPCGIEKLRNNYRWHVLVKAPRDADVSTVLTPLMRSVRMPSGVNVACDVDPASVV
jgi:primosomal protein N' (replication factor Y)